jgi:hypothetical protein
VSDYLSKRMMSIAIDFKLSCENCVCSKGMKFISSSSNFMELYGAKGLEKELPIAVPTTCP